MLAVHLVRVWGPGSRREPVPEPSRVLLHQLVHQRLFTDTSRAAERDDPRRRVLRHPPVAQEHGGQRVLSLVRHTRRGFRVGERVQQSIVKRSVRVVKPEIFPGPPGEPRDHRDGVGPDSIQDAVVLHQLERRLAQEQRPQLDGPRAGQRGAAEDVAGHPIVDPDASPLIHHPHPHRVLAVGTRRGFRRVLRVRAVVVFGPDVLPEEVVGVDGIRALVDEPQRVPHPLRRGISGEEDVLGDELAHLPRGRWVVRVRVLVHHGFLAVLGRRRRVLDEQHGGHFSGDERLGALPSLHEHREILGARLAVRLVPELTVLICDDVYGRIRGSAVCVDRVPRAGRRGSNAPDDRASAHGQKIYHSG